MILVVYQDSYVYTCSILRETSLLQNDPLGGWVGYQSCYPLIYYYYYYYYTRLTASFPGQPG